jgi:hypothetical protein
MTLLIENNTILVEYLRLAEDASLCSLINIAFLILKISPEISR